MPQNETCREDRAPGDAIPRDNLAFRCLNAIERLGNRLPDPVTLFFVGGLVVLVASEVAARYDWQVVNPTSGATERAISLLSAAGMRWVWQNCVTNFTSFPPLGVVLVGLIGIGIAERSGLVAALLKGLVVVMPRAWITPAFVFAGVMSNLAMDAGYLVLPPLAAAVFARAGRAPAVGVAVVFAGIAGGFSANLLITGLDPLLQSFTQTSAQLLQPDYQVDVRCNYYFMIASTFLVTLVGWGVTHWLVEPRFSRREVDAQLAELEPSMPRGTWSDDQRLSGAERRGLLVAAGALALGIGCLLSLILLPGAPLAGESEVRPGLTSPVWVQAIVPILLFVFLVPGIAYGVSVGSIRSDRDVARMMGETMSAMGPYIVLAFFAGQFVAWFGYSNLGRLLALGGVTWLKSLAMPRLFLVIGVVLLTAAVNLLIASASAKWALLSTVLVPVLMGVGISPELTQAAYRVGDSVTNTIAPLNPYMVIILVFVQRSIPRAGLGTVLALMLPYSLALLPSWLLLLIVWSILDWPLGPGSAPAFLPPLIDG